MRIPLEWLKQYVDVAATAAEVGVKLTMGGLEVEGIENDEEIVAWLLKEGRTRQQAEEAAAIGPNLDVYITPNRGDCLSLVGVGREVAALYALPLQVPTPPASQSGGEVDTYASVEIEAPDLCPRYAARVVRGVKIGPSPAWMQARLNAAGQRPINNVVDVTNYVMLELGQPLHAFDLNKLTGRKIVVRRAKEGETLRTLDDQMRELNSSMLVIADAEKAVAIAGIMGGGDSEVEDSTTDILLESAHFDPLSVRRTSRALKLRTEASYRFERVVDPDGVVRAVDRACELLAQIGQSGVTPGLIDVYPQPRSPRHLTLRVMRAAELLGMDITTDIATDCLIRLGFQVGPRVDSDTLNVQIPAFRADITLEEDLIEEVGRIYGYENIPETLPIGYTTPGGDSAEGRLIERIKQILAGVGLQEVVTHSLTAPAFFDSPADAAQRVPVRNALSTEISGLRRSLIPPLLDVARHNAAHQQHALALFEVGRVWQLQPNETSGNGSEPSGSMLPVEYVAIGGLLAGPLVAGDWRNGGKETSADFGMARGIVECLAQGLKLHGLTFLPPGDYGRELPQFHPGRTALIALNGPEGQQIIGVVGEVHPRVVETLDFRERLYVFEISLEALEQALPSTEKRYQELSRFPAVTRDLAPRIARSVLYTQVEAAVRSVDLPRLEAFRLTDVFEGAPLPEELKSVTLSFTFRAPDRTMQEAEVSESLDRLRHALESHCQATFPQ